MNIAVIGGYQCSKRIGRIAYEVGQRIAREGWVLVCGGREGVMEEACRGAKDAGGVTVGILPSCDGKDANKYVDITIPTGLGYARNVLVVRAASGIIAVDGRYGTLSEIAFAFNDPRPIVGIETWKVPGLHQAKSPEAAINYLKRKIGKVLCSTSSRSRSLLRRTE